MDPLIELNGVAFGYGPFNVLEEIDLHLHPGQFRWPGGAERRRKDIVAETRAGPAHAKLGADPARAA